MVVEGSLCCIFSVCFRGDVMHKGCGTCTATRRDVCSIIIADPDLFQLLSRRDEPVAGPKPLLAYVFARTPTAHPRPRFIP